MATSLVGYATCVLPYASDRGVGECKLLDLSRHHSLRGVRTSSLRYLSTSAQTEAVLDSMFVEWQQGNNPLLTVNDWMRAAYHLAQYLPSKRQEILSRQRARLTTDDARAEFDFVSRGCDTPPFGTGFALRLVAPGRESACRALGRADSSRSSTTPSANPITTASSFLPSMPWRRCSAPAPSTSLATGWQRFSPTIGARRRAPSSAAG